MGRLPDLSPDDMTPAQAEVYQSITSGVRGSASGPFSALLYSPELTSRVEQLGVYIRYECAVPLRQRELAICIVGAHWKADYEWHVNAPLAVKAGNAENTLDIISRGGTPEFDDATDAILHCFITELLRTTRVNDETYREAVAQFGEKGTVDLTGLVGYYSLLAMTLNTFEVYVPEDADIPWAE